MLIGCEGKASFAYLLFRFLEGLLQTISEEAEGPGSWLFFIPVYQVHVGSAGISLQVVTEEPAAVSVLMAIDAEIFPIAPVGWIVMVIPVPMMNRQQVTVRRIEGAATLCTGQPVDGQGSLTVPFVPRPDIFFQLPDDFLRRTARGTPALCRTGPDSACSRSVDYFRHNRNGNGKSDALLASPPIGYADSRGDRPLSGSRNTLQKTRNPLATPAIVDSDRTSGCFKRPRRIDSTSLRTPRIP